MFYAVDIGGTKVRVASSHLGHSLEHSVKFATPADTDRLIPLLKLAINKLAPGAPIDAISMAAPGPLDTTKGIILNPTNIPWKNYPIVREVKRAFDCPVHIEHDATCGGIAEARLGAGKSYRHVLYITISTGIGHSFIVSGNPVAGIHNPQSSNMIVITNEHLTTLENWTSGKAIKHEFGKIAADIHDKATWRVISRRLAILVHNLSGIYAPDVIVLGGGVSVHFDKFISYLRQDLAQLPHAYAVPPIKQAENVEFAPALGAMLLSHHR